MKYKIYVAGVWGFGNISIMEQFQNDAEVEFLKHDFKYFFQMQKVWNLVNRKLGGHGKSIIRWLLKTRFFDEKYALSHCDFDKNEKNYVVIFNSALLQYYSKEYFERLRNKHNNIEYILYIIDPMPNGLWPEIEAALDVFDEVMTIHPYNCKKYGLHYLPYIYAEPKEIPQCQIDKNTNLFFCGVAGDFRQNIISNIVEQCEKNHIVFDFWLKPYGNNAIDNEHVHYSEMTYAENVQRLKHAKCILEIMHEGFVGITQRYLEAVIYNKRLLTNNVEIKKLPYYNPQYMYYFEKVEDIDWNWVNEDVEVDYHYNGDFSPQKWKSNLLQFLQERESL